MVKMNKKVNKERNERIKDSGGNIKKNQGNMRITNYQEEWNQKKVKTTKVYPYLKR